jgi:hypothetical protein
MPLSGLDGGDQLNAADREGVDPDVMAFLNRVGLVRGFFAFCFGLRIAAVGLDVCAARGTAAMGEGEDNSTGVAAGAFIVGSCLVRIGPDWGEILGGGGGMDFDDEVARLAEMLGLARGLRGDKEANLNAPGEHLEGEPNV